MNAAEIPKFLILKCGDAHSFFSCDDPLAPCGGLARGIAQNAGCPLPNTCRR